MSIPRTRTVPSAVDAELERGWSTEVEIESKDPEPVPKQGTGGRAIRGPQNIMVDQEARGQPRIYLLLSNLWLLLLLSFIVIGNFIVTGKTWGRSRAVLQ